MARFSHLHVHSEYSLLEASSGVKDLAKQAAHWGQPALALTDLGNMFGAIEFYFACQSVGVKPILGLEAYLASGSRLEKGTQLDRDSMMRGPGRLVFLAQNYEGYQQLCRLSTAGFQEGFYYKPRIDLDLLKPDLVSNLVCLSGGVRSEVFLRYQRGDLNGAQDLLLSLQSIFQDRFYLEIQRGLGLGADFESYTDFLLETKKKKNIKIVAANEVYFLKQEDQVAQDVLVCIGSNRTLSDTHRPKLGSDQFYMKSSTQMEDLFRDLPEALDSVEEITQKVSIQFQLKDKNGKAIYHLPSFPTTEGRGLDEEIRLQAFEGLNERERQAQSRREHWADETRKEYERRLEYELSVIDRMGFNGYFLIVADFIKWAKQNNIPVGPGRGSGAGSLVAYCLQITDLDPVPYKLLFERFLNPERISMPDFDIDFCQDRRPEVIQYVTNKYGAGSVSQIITYGKLQCRAAIKDVGRVLGMGFSDVDVVTKLVPDQLNITIDEALKQESRLRELMESDPQVGTLIELAQKVEGLVRHAGIHAAGVIIADGELVKHAPLYRGAEGENVVQYDMKHAEKIGLIKFDFLGLKTLTLIHRALDLVRDNRGKSILSHQISLSDPGIYEIMSKGDTAGIFQFESDGITDAIRKIRPTNFFDITAINALYRPGPMAMIPEFAKRKHGEAPVEFLFPELKEVLEETYGIIVYQEQVMGIASIIAGYSLGEADMLRRAMGKKIKEEMDQHRLRFLKGAKEKGFEEKKSEELFELMYKFADYGFNKSHAAAYCVVAAQTAWLKNYYPVEFFAALLSTELSNTDNVVKYIKDARKRGIDVKAPHINSSGFLFAARGETIYFGLGAIKGVGQSAIEAILEGRKNKPEGFQSLSDFFDSVDVKKLNKKVVEAMIKAGALDGFGLHRAELMQNYPRFLDKAHAVRKNKELGQMSLFDLLEEKETPLSIDKVAPWPRSEELSYEKEVLGFYLSDHPLNGYDQWMGLWTTCALERLPVLLEEQHREQMQEDGKPHAQAKYPKHQKKRRCVVMGILTSVREVITKKGTRMAFAQLEDLSAAAELIVFPDVFSQVQGILKPDQPVLVGGLLEGEPGAPMPKLIVDRVMAIGEALKKVKRLVVKLQELSEPEVTELISLLRAYPGATHLDFQLEISELGQKVNLASPLGEAGVTLSQTLLETLQTRFGRTTFLEVH